MSGVSRQIEALLFLSPDPLPVVTLCEITDEPPGAVQRGLAELAERHGPEAGLEVVEIAGGFTLRTRADLAPVCDRLRERPPDDRLSPAALETLAVVAYLEPVSRPQISRLRGVAVDSTVVSLVDRGLIEEAGRPAGGGAMRYRTTRAFQERFGLRHSGDLPPLEGFELTGPEADRIRAKLVGAGHLVEGAGGSLGEGVQLDEAPPVQSDAPSGDVQLDEPPSVRSHAPAGGVQWDADAGVQLHVDPTSGEVGEDDAEGPETPGDRGPDGG